MSQWLDPFAPWEDHTPDDCTACALDAMVEHPPEVTNLRAELAKLVPEVGHWNNAGSLKRFNAEQMNLSQLTRFMKKIRPVQIDWHTPCWLWDGGTHEKGYGRFYLGLVDNKRVHTYTHRIAFEHWIGFPPDGYIVDHQCNHKLCCNPTHLWPETNDNNLRLADARRPWQRRNQYSKE